MLARSFNGGHGVSMLQAIKNSLIPTNPVAGSAVKNRNSVVPSYKSLT